MLFCAHSITEVTSVQFHSKSFSTKKVSAEHHPSERQGQTAKMFYLHYLEEWTPTIPVCLLDWIADVTCSVYDCDIMKSDYVSLYVLIEVLCSGRRLWLTRAKRLHFPPFINFFPKQLGLPLHSSCTYQNWPYSNHYLGDSEGMTRAYQKVCII